MLLVMNRFLFQLIIWLFRCVWICCLFMLKFLFIYRFSRWVLNVRLLWVLLFSLLLLMFFGVLNDSVLVVLVVVKLWIQVLCVMKVMFLGIFSNSLWVFLRQLVNMLLWLQFRLFWLVMLEFCVRQLEGVLCLVGFWLIRLQFCDLVCRFMFVVIVELKELLRVLVLNVNFIVSGVVYVMIRFEVFVIIFFMLVFDLVLVSVC